MGVKIRQKKINGIVILKTLKATRINVQDKKT